MEKIAATEIDQERYIFGRYDNFELDLAFSDVRENITNWLENLDKVIHVPYRLSILSILYQNRILSFTILKRLLKATSGNLNNHLTKLNDAGLVEISKILTEAKPITLITITEEGRRRFEGYVTMFSKTFESCGT